MSVPSLAIRDAMDRHFTHGPRFNGKVIDPASLKAEYESGVVRVFEVELGLIAIYQVVPCQHFIVNLSLLWQRPDVVLYRHEGQIPAAQ